MKKLVCIVVVLMLLSGTATVKAVLPTAPENSGSLLFVSDAALMGDAERDAAIWQGISQFAQREGIFCRWETVTLGSAQSRRAAIERGILQGATVVICAGYAYEGVVYQLQNAYPQVMFLLLDGEPYDREEAVYETAFNTHCITCQEAEAGFLAGYAAVMEGYRNLGFCGSVPVESVNRYGYGFVQGAEQAAADLNLPRGDVQLRFWYAGETMEMGQLLAELGAWYAEGCQVIFLAEEAGLQVTHSGILAATLSGGKVIAADADRHGKSVSVLSSAVKGYAWSVEEALESLAQNDGFWNTQRSGSTMLLWGAQGGVSLALADSAWRFTQFSREDYEKLLLQIFEGAITVETASGRDVMPEGRLCTLDYLGEG